MRPSPRAVTWCVLGAITIPVLLVTVSLHADDAAVGISREFDLSRIHWTTEAGAPRFEWEGLDALAVSGAPDLPVERITLEPPPGMKLVDVRVTVGSVASEPLALPPAPYAGSLPLLGERVDADPAIYAGEAIFPGAWARAGEGGYLRGTRIDVIEIHPARWDPASNRLLLAGRVEVEPIFAPDTGDRVVPRPVQWLGPDTFARARDRLIDERMTRAPRPRLAPAVNGSTPFSPRFRPSEDGSAVQYLIIAPPALVPSYERLADWKTALGIPTVVRSFEWVLQNYPDRFDHAATLRDFIREAVAEWGVEYVLLGADYPGLPIRYAHSYYYGGEDIPTDLYLSALDGNWNGNFNEIFAEPYFNATFTGDSADLFPEVWIGRAPARFAVEADTFVEKVIEYESNAPVGPGFGEKNLFLAEMLFPQHWVEGDTIIFDGAAVAESAYVRVDPGIDVLRMYENYTQFSGAVLEDKPAVLTQMNQGYNLILHVGHGFRNTMAVGLLGKTLVNGDADGLSNAERRGLLYAINCTSSAFDFDCISEHFIRNPNGGVVASIGSARLDWPETGWNYQNEFFELVYSNGVTRLGEAAAQQRFPYIASANKDGEHRWTQFSLMFMGDPTLDLYTAPVGTLDVAGISTIPVGAGTTCVVVTAGGLPVEGATVCLNKAGDAYGMALTNASGVAAIPFAPDLPGQVSLGVRAHNYLSVVDTIDVVPPANAYPYFADAAVDDTPGGNGNNNPEAGETLLVTPKIGNSGLATATGLSATIVGVPAGVNVLDGVSNCPDVLPDSCGTCSDTWEIELDPTLPDHSLLDFTVQIDEAGSSRTLPWVFYVGGPDIVHEITLRDDSVGNGNGNGILEANEDQFVTVRLENRGLGRSAGLSATLSSTEPEVLIIDGTSAYGDLDAGAVSDGDGFLLQITDGIASHTMDLVVSDERGVILTKTIELAPPGPTIGLLAAGGATNIQLEWFPTPAADVAGYNVYRAPALGGPYVLANEVLTDHISYYVDEDLPPLTRQYYKVAAVDASGNEGPLSGVAEATTSLVQHAAFPVETGAATSSSPGLAFLTGDPKAELVTGGQEIIVTLDDGTEYVDGDNDTRTYGVFSNTGVGPFWAPPSVADLEPDGSQEIVSVSFNTGQLYVWNQHTGPKPGWPKNLNIDGSPTLNSWGAAALADLDLDGDMEIVVNSGRYTFAFHHDGTELVDGDSDPATTGVLFQHGVAFNYGTPALADIDGLPGLEIIVASRDGNLYVYDASGSPLPGFPWYSGGQMTGSPAIGDLDKDGLPEIVVGNSALQMHAVDKDLNSPPGWPAGANMNQDLDSSPALADMDGDGFLDVIVCAGNGTVYMWHGQNGALFPGWGFVLFDASGAKVPLSSSPAVGNLDADPEYEVCFGGGDGILYAYNIDATQVDGFPIGTANSIEGGPLLWDIDQDGFTEVVAHSLDQNLYVWKSPGAFDPGNQPWPMFHHDSRRTGSATDPIWVVTGVDEPAPTPSLSLSPNFPNPFRAQTTIQFVVPEGVGEYLELSIFDISGRRVRRLIEGRQTPGVQNVRWDGRDDAGRRVGAGVYFYRLTGAARQESRKLVLLP